MTIIGVDCAVNPKNAGLARGIFGASQTAVTHVKTHSETSPIAESISPWIEGSDKTLLAFDAPLGWPLSLGKVLSRHRAGQSISVTANRMFRRRTDSLVKEHIGKLPLDVGADRIARTALAALQILEELREITGERIPLAWEPDFDSRIAAIEGNDHALDAVVCILAARDFLKGDAMKPEDPDLSRREGWIWIKPIRHR